MTGRVIKSTGSRYLVKYGTRVLECVLKGKLRLEGRKTTNPVAVGDIVDVSITEGEGAAITRIHPRKNYIIRKSINLSRQAQIIASNLDQAVLIVTIVAPRTSLGFIDRFLVTAEAYRVPARIVFNKCDLLDETLRALQQEIIDIYQKAGYPCYEVSSLDPQSVKQLIVLLKDKTTLLSGHSGVGKSTLINALEPGLKLKTGDISSVHLKGMHTTTFAELHELQIGAIHAPTLLLAQRLWGWDPERWFLVPWVRGRGEIVLAAWLASWGWGTWWWHLVVPGVWRAVVFGVAGHPPSAVGRVLRARRHRGPDAPGHPPDSLLPRDRPDARHAAQHCREVTHESDVPGRPP